MIEIDREKSQIDVALSDIRDLAQGFLYLRLYKQHEIVCTAIEEIQSAVKQIEKKIDRDLTNQLNEARKQVGQTLSALVRP